MEPGVGDLLMRRNDAPTVTVEDVVRARGNPALSPRLDDIRAWWTSERFGRAWDRCLKEHTRLTLLAFVGIPQIDGRLVRSWRSDDVIPSWWYLSKLDDLFRIVIGNDWMQRIEAEEQECAGAG